MNYYKSSQYDAQCTGKLLNYEAKTTMYQSDYGANKKVEYYTAFFSYNVKGKTYQGSDILPGNSANGIALRHILRSSDKLI